LPFVVKSELVPETLCSKRQVAADQLAFGYTCAVKGMRGSAVAEFFAEEHATQTIQCILGACREEQGHDAVYTLYT
jgi:hypothetical protein